MNSGRIVVSPPKRLEKNLNNIVAGNTALYGATGGKLFVSGELENVLQLETLEQRSH